MKRYLLAIVLLLPFILQAKVAVEKPRSKQPTAFAIVVDQATYDKTAPQIHAYRDVLEADGLSTYILRDNWQTPEQVREQLIALMRKTALPERWAFWTAGAFRPPPGRRRSYRS